MSEITNLEQNLIIKKIDSETINAQINKRFLSFSFAIKDAFNKGAAILFISFLRLPGNKAIILLSNGKPKLFLEDSIFGVLDKRSANGCPIYLLGTPYLS